MCGSLEKLFTRFNEILDLYIGICKVKRKKLIVVERCVGRCVGRCVARCVHRCHNAKRFITIKIIGGYVPTFHLSLGRCHQQRNKLAQVTRRRIVR